MATPAIPNDHTIDYQQDMIDRPIKETQYPKDGSAAEARTTNYCYDLAGDLRSVTTPRGDRADAPIRFSGCPAAVAPADYAYTPASYTTKISYAADHTPRSFAEPLGDAWSESYDPNGNVETVTDERGNVERRTYDQRDDLTQFELPFDPSRPLRKLTTKFEYDGVGNLTREITPRAVDTQGAGPYINYVTSYEYDELDQPVKTKLPVDASTRQAWLHSDYDANGNLISSSLAVDTDNPALILKEQKTQLTVFDPGWVRTSDDPGKGVVSFAHDAEGQQTSRIPTGAAAESWTYYDDSQLKENKDPNGHPNTFTYDLDDNLIKIDDATGADNEAEAPIKVEQDYNGFAEVTEIRQKKEKPGEIKPWRVTAFSYDPNSNLGERVDDGGRQIFGYDEADRVTSQTNENAAGCADDLQTTTTYLPTGAEAGRVTKRSDGGCDPGTWPVRQQTVWTYFENSDLETLKTWKGAQTDANLVESHTIGYEVSGVYLNGNRTTDSFTLQGPGSAPCRSAACTASYGYDGRERMRSWDNGFSGADASSTAYTIDADTVAVDSLEGNVTREDVTGAGAMTRDYRYTAAGQLKDVSEAGQVKELYFYDVRSGDIRCVTDPGYPASTCDGDGSATPGLRDWYAFDPLNRLKAFKSHRVGKAVDSSYVYDAMDRVSAQSETHNGGSARRTEFGYLGISGNVSTETQTGSSAANKRYSYSVEDQRTAMSVTSAGTTDYTFGRNVHGDVSVLLAGGSVAASYGYKPYGDQLDLLTGGDPKGSNPLNPFRFNDRRYDSGSGSVEMGPRRFSSETGRFLQLDFHRQGDEDIELAADALAQNRYGFAGGNPVSFAEFDGHVVTPDGGGGSTRPRQRGCAAQPGYPLSKKGRVIGRPGQGTHSWTEPPNNWQSDNAIDISVPVYTGMCAPVAGKIGNRGAFGCQIEDRRECLDISNRTAGRRFYLNTARNSLFFQHAYSIRVRLGQRVRRGHYLGTTLGGNGSPHLHLGVQRGTPYPLIGCRGSQNPSRRYC